MINKDLPSDNIYGYALSQTLMKVAAPVTVGLYSPCHSRVNMLLKSIEAHMKNEAERKEQNYGGIKPRSTSSATYFLSAIIKMLFYIPMWTEQNQSHTNVRYIFVKFSAWHFAGSDMLWAGLVMRLYETLQLSFGKLLIPLYRITQHEEEEVKRVIEDSEKDWRPRKICCCPLWSLLVVVLTVILVIAVLLIKCGLSRSGAEAEVKGGLGMFEGFAIGILGFPAFGVCQFIFKLIKNLIMNPGFNIRCNMNNSKVSNKLGFMNEVWKEMRVISCFIQFMEVFERRKIRVVLQITYLDRCTPKRITGVLDAINILLSDEESPFISMIAVNPEILVQQLDYADGCLSKEDRARAFLNRIVTLPFTVPELCDISKCKVFRSIAHHLSRSKQEFPMDEIPSVSHVQTSEKSEEIELRRPLISKDCNIIFKPIEEELENLIESAFECIYSEKGKLHSYLTGDTISMRRIINSIRVTVIIMEVMKVELPSMEVLAAWVVLADQWPCRLSWILECLEDQQQRVELGRESSIAAGKTLWEVFSKSRLELYMIRDQINMHQEQDGDPELFELFLKVDFKLTVKDANRFELATVNLDHSIKKELSRIRGSSARRDTVGKETLIPLPISSVINMSTEDVCNELVRLKLPEKYNEVIRENELNGQTLLYSKNGEIKRVLQMSMGEWTTFSIHFLGICPPRFPLLQSASPPRPSAVTLGDCFHSHCHPEKPERTLHAYDS
ncbi:NTPase KAP family P-loop domain-containing protein 1 [Conger conger]|uniref:NTPase KAP family P-loop domain-containing protein 1 n=1 Tax=Conger conger TaxID=82655 RepID=UPI002A59FFA6|nr:NTPase KAP family P-loop domain-containing protein 1 [Conger conger]